VDASVDRTYGVRQFQIAIEEFGVQGPKRRVRGEDPVDAVDSATERRQRIGVTGADSR
jgi:hypothetical protein